MHVVKRDGRREPVMFDKITARVRRLCWGLDERYIDPVLIAQKVVQGIYSGVTTWELDTLAAETCAYMNTEHPHYARLAARISVSNLQRSTSPSFADTIDELHAYVDPKTGRQAGYISDEVHATVMKYRDVIDAEVQHERDFSFDYFGFKVRMQLPPPNADIPGNLVTELFLSAGAPRVLMTLHSHPPFEHRGCVHDTFGMPNIGWLMQSQSPLAVGCLEGFDRRGR
ncbi:unnamed protein product [Sphacelaria rigidula]